MAEEEEETFVFVEFTGLPDDKVLKQYKGTCSLLVGWDFVHLCCWDIYVTSYQCYSLQKADNSTEVILQLDRYTFRGSLEGM